MTILIDRISKQGKQFQIRYENGEFIATHGGEELARSREFGYRAKGMHNFSGIGITFAEGDILRDAYYAYIATLPRTITRQDLVNDLNGLLDEQEYAFTRAHDRADARAWDIKASYDARIEAARQALADYDAAHPRQPQPVSAGVARALRGED